MRYAWILFAVIYAAFAIRFAVGRVRNIISTHHEFCYANAGKWYYWPLLVLFFLVFAATFWLWLLFWPRRQWYKRKERRRQEREEAERKTQEERVRKWIEEHQPTLHYNTVNGVTAVVPKADYDAAIRKRTRDLRNGQTTEKLLPLLPRTCLFVHASTKNVPERFQSGWLSDFDDLKGVAKVERRKDIFVPFVSETAMPFPEQEKALRKPTSAANPAARLEEARGFLLHVPVPDQVRFGKS